MSKNQNPNVQYLDKPQKYEEERHRQKKSSQNRHRSEEAQKKSRHKEKRSRKHKSSRSSSHSNPSRIEESKNEVIVKGLNFQANENEIISFLEKNFGRVEKMNLLRENDGRSKGLAFVTFKSEESSIKAIENSNINFLGRYLAIEKIKPRYERMGSILDETQKTIFVGNLSFKTGSEDLRKFFQSCGEIIDARVAQQDGKSRGFGHVEFADVSGVKKALKKGGEEIDGRQIKVDIAASKQKRQNYDYYDNNRGYNRNYSNNDFYQNRNDYSRNDRYDYSRYDNKRNEFNGQRSSTRYDNFSNKGDRYYNNRYDRNEDLHKNGRSGNHYEGRGVERGYDRQRERSPDYR